MPWAAAEPLVGRAARTSRGPADGRCRSSSWVWRQALTKPPRSVRAPARLSSVKCRRSSARTRSPASEQEQQGERPRRVPGHLAVEVVRVGEVPVQAARAGAQRGQGLSGRSAPISAYARTATQRSRRSSPLDHSSRMRGMFGVSMRWARVSALTADQAVPEAVGGRPGLDDQRHRRGQVGAGQDGHRGRGPGADEGRPSSASRRSQSISAGRAEGWPVQTSRRRRREARSSWKAAFCWVTRAPLGVLLVLVAARRGRAGGACRCGCRRPGSRGPGTGSRSAGGSGRAGR